MEDRGEGNTRQFVLVARDPKMLNPKKREGELKAYIPWHACHGIAKCGQCGSQGWRTHGFPHVRVVEQVKAFAREPLVQKVAQLHRLEGERELVLPVVRAVPVSAASLGGEEVDDRGCLCATRRCTLANKKQ